MHNNRRVWHKLPFVPATSLLGVLIGSGRGTYDHMTNKQTLCTQTFKLDLNTIIMGYIQIKCYQSSWITFKIWHCCTSYAHKKVKQLPHCAKKIWSCPFKAPHCQTCHIPVDVVGPPSNQAPHYFLFCVRVRVCVCVWLPAERNTCFSLEI